MAILDIQVGFTGRANAETNLAFINTDNTVAEVLATGFLDPIVRMGNSLNESNICLVRTKTSASATSSQVGWYEVSISAGSYSLVPTASPGAVVLPTIVNHIAYFTNVTGTLSSAAGVTTINSGSIQAGLSGTAGTFISFPSAATKGSLILAAVANTGNTNVTISNALHGQASVYSVPDCGASTANFIVSKTTGTQQITVGSLQVTAGDMTVGLSTGGTAGRFVSFSATTTAGSLIMEHLANGSGNFNTTIRTSSAVGQNQVLSIPDVGNATGRFVVTSNTFTAGNLIMGTAVQYSTNDAGIAATDVQLKSNIKAVAVTGLGGAGAGPLTVTAAGCTTTSIVVFQINSSSNTVSVAKVVPGTGSFTVLLSGDPGATLTGKYIMFIAAQ